MYIKCQISCSTSNLLSSAQVWWWHLRTFSSQTLKIHSTLTISARSSNPLAVVVKCWSKAKVEVVMLHSGPEGVLRADITAFLSVVHWHGQPACSQSGCRWCRGSCVSVPDSNKDTPVGTDKYCISARILITVDKHWSCALSHSPSFKNHWLKKKGVCWVRVRC